jgi:hypothetical protein
MHDVQLEDRLRRALRAEADSLPFTLTGDQLQIRLAARRRAAWNQRLTILAAAALAAVAVGVGAFLLTRQPEDAIVVVSPSPSGVPSPSVPPSESPTPAPSATPEPTPQPTQRPTGPIGAPNDAVLATFVGDPARPDRIDLTLTTIDAGALETSFTPRPLASFAGSTIPAGLQLDATYAPRFGTDGWLAIGAIDTATSGSRILVYDVRAPGAAPWLVPGALRAAAWGPGSTLAVTDGRVIQLYDAANHDTGSLDIPAGVWVADHDDFTGSDPATWLADGSGFLARQSEDGFSGAFGSVSPTGAFVASAVPPAQLQATGFTRRWGADGSGRTGGCPTEGGPPGCSVGTSTPSGDVSTDWYVTDAGLGDIAADMFDAEGDGLWLVVNRTADGPNAFVIMHADEPNAWTDIASFTMPVGVYAYLVGVRDAEPTADGKVFLFAAPDQPYRLVTAVSADGSHNSFGGTSIFAGWAGEQPAYPVP